MSDFLEPKIKDIIVEQLGIEPEKVSLKASFVDDLNADSLDIAELIMAMEETFDMEISDEDTQGLKTVGSVQDYLIKKNALPKTQ